MAGITVRPSDGETLNVLDMPLRFPCDAHETDGAWSLTLSLPTDRCAMLA